MTLEDTNFGSEYGIEMRPYQEKWTSIHPPGEGFETYEEAYQEALLKKDFVPVNCLRVVVYDYDDAIRKNIRILTLI